MKKLFASLVMLASIVNAAEVWKMERPAPWARDAKTKKIEVTNKTSDGFDLIYEGAADFSVNGMPVVEVKAGDKFRLSCDTAELKNDLQQGKLSLGVVLYDDKGEVVSWSYGKTSGKIGGKLISEFAIPFGIAKVQGRVMGWGAVAAQIKDIRLERTGNILRNTNLANMPQEISLSSESLAMTLSTKTLGLSVVDKRTGCKWLPVERKLAGMIAVNASKTDDSISLTLINFELLKEYTAEFRFDKKAPNELLVTIGGEGSMNQPFTYPLPLASRKGDRLIVPMNEGISYPVNEDDIGPAKQLIAYGGHGICMAFFGVQSDAKGDGWMAILETPDDAMMVGSRGVDKLWTLGPSWVAQKKKFGYPRKVRYVFFEKGGFVTMAKRYREYAKKIGLYKPFTEKVKKRANIDRLLGAVNLWHWHDAGAVALIKDMEAAGIDRILYSGGGSSKVVTEISKMPKHLISRYDVYQDIYHPEQLKKLGWKNGNRNTDAWPHDVMWSSEKSNDWTRAWGVKAKDGTWTYCANMCDLAAPKYERRNVAKELKTKPYNTRFIDTTVASAWKECYNPDHPMTRSQSRAARMELLGLLGDEFGLVTGSETGHDASVPFCDYYEGMLSLGPYRVPDSGRRIQQIWTNVPPRVAKYQVGEKYRLPLWELVYHDCVCAHWYWGDYNNKLPDLWHKRDLFNVLYGTMGMFVLNEKQWQADKDKFVRSFKITSPVARQTGYSEMTDFKILTEDRSVQQSHFANGITVTVNFGEKDYRLADGTVVKASDYHVKGLK